MCRKYKQTVDRLNDGKEDLLNTSNFQQNIFMTDKF